MACNPILEAFGNAATRSNDNSSRFGKYVTMSIDPVTQQCLGAHTQNYLLEKSRVTSTGPSERNFHIFYFLCKGADITELMELDLAQGQSLDICQRFRLLNTSAVSEVPTVDDVNCYYDVKESFKKLGFSAEEEAAIWRVIAGILHLGDIEFDESTLTKETGCSVIEGKPLERLAKQLSVDGMVLLEELTHKNIRYPGETKYYKTPLKLHQCNQNRDSLAKALYELLFKYLVKRLNMTILPPNKNIQELKIGLLDIFGFECLESNSFEQLCINYANEKLHYLFIGYVQESEKKCFREQGLGEYLGDISFTDNRLVLSLLDKKGTGLFQMVDDDRFGDDGKLLERFDKIQRRCKGYIKNKLSKEHFMVIHTAKQVNYNITGFCLKNKDELDTSTLQVIINSKNTHISQIFTLMNNPNKVRGRNKKLLGAKFRLQMKELTFELSQSGCHFIRCLKPNDEKLAGVISTAVVLNQIQYLGILEIINVRRNLFPIRMSYVKLYTDFFEMISVFGKVHQNKKEKCQRFLNEYLPGVGTEAYLCGTDMVFMTNLVYLTLQKLLKLYREVVNQAAGRIQRKFIRKQAGKVRKNAVRSFSTCVQKWKSREMKNRFQFIRNMAIRLQRIFRWQQAINFQRRELKAVVNIQKTWKMYKIRQKFRNILSAASIITKFYRGMMARNLVFKMKMANEIYLKTIDEAWLQVKFEAESIAMVEIQRWVRGYLSRRANWGKVVKIREYIRKYRTVRAVFFIQRFVRGFIVRAHMARLRRAAYYIQGHFRMLWLSSLFQRLKASASIIQRCWRHYYLKKTAVNERMKEFLATIIPLERVIIQAEQSVLFNKKMQLNKREEITSCTEEWTKDPSNSQKTNPLFYYKMLQDFQPSQPIQQRVKIAKNKISVFALPLDLEILSDITGVYEPLWAQSFQKLYSGLVKQDSEIQQIVLGATHTFVATNQDQLFTWGWNGEGQLGRDEPKVNHPYRPSQIELPVNIQVHMIASGEDHSAILDDDNNLWLWGSNHHGQLGLGHCNEVNDLILIDDLSPNEKISQIHVQGKKNYAIMENGKVFTWPFIAANGQIFAQPIYLDLLSHSRIKTMCCGENFAIFLTTKGQVYSLGKDNREGQLGHGDKYGKEKPQIIESFIEERVKVDQIACGYKHVICRSTRKQVFTWGWGAKGQLGHGKLCSVLQPKEVDLSKWKCVQSVLQVEAGFQCSIILLDNKKIFWWGQNGQIQSQSKPLQLKLDNDKLLPIRLQTTWCKTMSFIYATMANTSQFKHTFISTQRILNNLSSKWSETGFRQMRPKFSKAHQNYFSTKNMKITHEVNRKFKHRGQNVPRRKNPFKYSQVLKKFRRQGQDVEAKLPRNLDYLRAIRMKEKVLETEEEKVESQLLEEEVESESGTEHSKVEKVMSKEEIITNLDDDTQLFSFKFAQFPRIQNLKRFKLKVKEILKKDLQEWTKKDRKFIKMIHENHLSGILDAV